MVERLRLVDREVTLGPRIGAKPILDIVEREFCVR